MHRVMKYPRRLGLQLLDFVYPLTCLLCGVKVPPDAGELCAGCLETFPNNTPPFCPFCGQGRLLEPDPACCPSCQGRPFLFDQAWSAMLYEGPVRDCLHHFKYRERYLLSKPLTERLVRFAQRFLPLRGFDAIVPVPLSRRRENERGFNQSFLLSRGLSRALDLPLLRHSLVRWRQTPSQISLSREGRLKNVAGAFRVKQLPPLQEKRLLLVDDVFTTGATVNACAAVLKEAGAASVSVLTLARGQ